MNPIRRGTPGKADENTFKFLEGISSSCKTCQVFFMKPQRFQVSLPPSEIVLNKEVAIVLMWLSKKAVLHTVDTETHINSAAFLKGQTVEDIWNAFVYCWSSMYQGNSGKIRTDQGAVLLQLHGRNFVIWWELLCNILALKGTIIYALRNDIMNRYVEIWTKWCSALGGVRVWRSTVAVVRNVSGPLSR